MSDTTTTDPLGGPPAQDETLAANDGCNAADDACQAGATTTTALPCWDEVGDPLPGQERCRAAGTHPCAPGEAAGFDGLCFDPPAPLAITGPATAETTAAAEPSFVAQPIFGQPSPPLDFDTVIDCESATPYVQVRACGHPDEGGLVQREIDVVAQAMSAQAAVGQPPVPAQHSLPATGGAPIGSLAFGGTLAVVVGIALARLRAAR